MIHRSFNWHISRYIIYNYCSLLRLCNISSWILVFHLLCLLQQGRVLHSSCQHSKEERRQEGAEVQGHSGDGVGHHHFLPLPVHRLQYLIGQDWGPHAMGHLPRDNCETVDVVKCPVRDRNISKTFTKESFQGPGGRLNIKLEQDIQSMTSQSHSFCVIIIHCQPLIFRRKIEPLM